MRFTDTISRQSLRSAAVFLFGVVTVANAQIPDFLSRQMQRNAGNLELEVFYGNNQITDGERLSVQAAETPTKFALCDSCGISTSSRFIILLVDVDIPNARGSESPQFLHSIQTDFRITDATELQSTTAPPLPYVPPSPPSGSGPHRYVWLLYNQPISGFTLRGVPSENERGQFDVQAWERENGFDADGPEWALHFVAEEGADDQQSSSLVVTRTVSPPGTLTVTRNTDSLGSTLTVTRTEITTTGTVTRTEITSTGTVTRTGTTTTTRVGLNSTSTRSVSSSPSTLSTSTVTLSTTTILVTPSGNGTESPSPSESGDAGGAAVALHSDGYFSLAAAVLAAAGIFAF